MPEFDAESSLPEELLGARAAYLKELRAVRKTHEESGLRMAVLAKQAARAGASLAQIGDVLGISKQAVKYRYFKADDPIPKGTRPRSNKSQKDAA